MVREKIKSTRAQIVIICLLFVGFLITLLFASGCTDSIITKPKLLVYSSGENKIELLGRGCYGRIAGSVTNTGNGDAQGVVIRCDSRGVFNSQALGTIIAGQQNSFNMDLDYECGDSEPIYRCTASCNNC